MKHSTDLPLLESCALQETINRFVKEIFLLYAFPKKLVTCIGVDPIMNVPYYNVIQNLLQLRLNLAQTFNYSIYFTPPQLEISTITEHKPFTIALICFLMWYFLEVIFYFTILNNFDWSYFLLFALWKQVYKLNCY